MSDIRKVKHTIGELYRIKESYRVENDRLQAELANLREEHEVERVLRLDEKEDLGYFSEQIGKLEADNARLQAELATQKKVTAEWKQLCEEGVDGWKEVFRLRECLKRLEWSSHQGWPGHLACPVCHAYEVHKLDCWLAAEIARKAVKS
jgi:hypothetical protein